MSSPVGDAATTPWSPADIGSLQGTRGLVTGVTSGLGLHVATELARAGTEVVLAARNPKKLEETRQQILEQVPAASLVPLTLDLADLASVRAAAAAAAALGPLDLLVNNAGVMATPYQRTIDGFELQMGTNHFGHFALTGLLWPALTAAPAARVVTVSSQMARTVRGVSTADPRQPAGHYRRWSSYGQSKLANLLFTRELDRRVRAAGLPVTAVAAHPGYSHTNLVNAGLNHDRPRLEGAIGIALTRLVGQSAYAGALPLLRAATDPGVSGGQYVGPRGPFQLHGQPVVVSMPRTAQDPGAALSLWKLSEGATGVAFV